jgi:hypothetical protein
MTLDGEVVSNRKPGMSPGAHAQLPDIQHSPVQASAEDTSTLIHSPTEALDALFTHLLTPVNPSVEFETR